MPAAKGAAKGAARGAARGAAATTRVRPVRLEAAYSHVRPRWAQRAQVGCSLSLMHLTLELAQLVQLSLNLRGLGVLVMDRRVAVKDSMAWGAAISAMIRLLTFPGQFRRATAGSARKKIDTLTELLL
jgi:hypothetical protein